VHKGLSNTTGNRQKKSNSKSVPKVEEQISEISGLEGIAESRNSGGIPGLLNILQNIENAKRLRNWKIY